jgi:hypothetical protein
MSEAPRIDLAVWRWRSGQPLPADIKALHRDLDQGVPHTAMAPFDTAAFLAALHGLFQRAGQGPWSYEVVDGNDASWVRFHVDIGLIQLFAPQLVNIACVHELVISDPHNDHIIGA